MPQLLLKLKQEHREALHAQQYEGSVTEIIASTGTG